MTEALAELPAIEEQLGELAGIEERLRLGSGLAERSAELAKTRAQLEAVPEIDERSVLAALEAAAPRWSEPGPPRQGPRPSAPTERRS